MSRPASLNDLSPLGPPISDFIGRLYFLSTVIAFVLVSCYTSRPLLLRLGVTALFGGNVYLLLTKPNVMGHIPGHFDALIANFIFASWVRIIQLYFVQDRGRGVSKTAERAPRDASKAEGKATGQQVLDSGSGVLRRKLETKAVTADENKLSEQVTRDSHLPPFTPFEAVDYLLIDHRNISSKYFQRARNVPLQQLYPSRSSFLFSCLASAGISYFLLDLLTNQPPLPPHYFTSRHDFLFGRIREVDAMEIWCRFVINFNLWVSVLLMLRYTHSILAFVGVASGLYEPEDWPPVVGSRADEYSIKNHWSKVWHQMFQVPYVAVCGAFVELLLSPLPKGSRLRSKRGALARYLTTLAVFLLSMSAHMIQPLGVTGGAPQFWSSCWYFPMQVAGMMFEEFVSALWAKAVGEKLGRWHGPIERTVGRLWLLVWMLWTVPPWVYPSLRRGEEGAMMPYSIVRKIKSIAKA